MSRYETNRQVQSVLVRHAVDLVRCEYSCTSTAVHLWGGLKKDPAGEFTADGVAALMAELARLPGVRHIEAEFGNWNVCRGDGAWLVTPKRLPSGGGGAPRTLVVEQPEPIEDVLREAAEQERERRACGKGTSK